MSLETQPRAHPSGKPLRKATHWEWNKIGVELWTDKVTTTEEKGCGMKFVADFLVGIGASVKKDLTKRAETTRLHELGHALRHAQGKYTDGRGAFRLRVTLPSTTIFRIDTSLPFESGYAFNDKRILKGEGPQVLLDILNGPKVDGLELSTSDKDKIEEIKQEFNID